VKPARRGNPRRRQVEIQDRLGLLGDRQHLAVEQPAEHPVRPCRLVHRRHVDQLVIHDHVHALVGGKRLERKSQRRDLHADQVARHRGRAGVAGVTQVQHQHRQVFLGIKTEQFFLEGERVERGARDVRDEVALGDVEIDDTQPR
jgi:hypothetical protein